MHDDVTKYLASEPFKSFLATWQTARDDEDIPFRHRIELRAFASHAENLVIYQRKGRRDLRYRLTGSQVANRVDNIGPEVNLFDFFVPGTLDDAELWWNAIFDTPCGAIMDFSMTYPDGNVKEVVTLLLPIKTAYERDMILSLHKVGDIVRVTKPRSHVLVAEDYVSGYYFDVGFGLPASPPEYWPYKPRQK